MSTKGAALEAERSSAISVASSKSSKPRALPLPTKRGQPTGPALLVLS